MLGVFETHKGSTKLSKILSLRPLPESEIRIPEAKGKGTIPSSSQIRNLNNEREPELLPPGNRINSNQDRFYKILFFLLFSDPTLMVGFPSTT
jgi:hypothetical protein